MKNFLPIVSCIILCTFANIQIAHSQNNTSEVIAVFSSKKDVKDAFLMSGEKNITFGIQGLSSDAISAGLVSQVTTYSDKVLSFSISEEQGDQSRIATISLKEEVTLAWFTKLLITHEIRTIKIDHYYILTETLND